MKRPYKRRKIKAKSHEEYQHRYYLRVTKQKRSAKRRRGK